MLPLVLSLLIPIADAAPCNTRALRAQIVSGSPAEAGEAFVTLADCNAPEARRQARPAFNRMVDADTAKDAVVAAVKLGVSDVVREWLDSQLPDVRSRAISNLAKVCGSEPAIAKMFTDAYRELDAKFFEDRWHRGLTTCREPGVQAVLQEALDHPDVGRNTRNRAQFVGLLEVYARNLGADALPTLRSYLEDPRDEEEAALVITTLGDAADVGGVDGANPEAAKAIRDMISDLAPNLPTRALERARGVLTSLKFTSEASALAKHRWADRFNGTYQYGVATIEDVTCKNGKQRVVVHLGKATEAGNRWPDELIGDVEAAARNTWSYDAARKCKGTAEVSFIFSQEPIANDQAVKLWQQQQAEEAQKANPNAQKVWVEAAPTIEL